MSNVEVSGIDIDGTELVNVQVGNTLFRDGGPYGDQSDAIRDEKVNASREGREPNFDSLIPVQYLLKPKEEVKAQVLAVESQRQNFEQETIYLTKDAPYEKNVRSTKAKTITTSDSDKAQANSEDVARAALVEPNPAPKHAEESKPADDFDNL